MCLDASLGAADGGSTSLFCVGGKPGHEGREVHDSFLLVEPEVVVQKKEELLLHEIDLRGVEHATSVLCPMLVLRRGVVEVLAGDD